MRSVFWEIFANKINKEMMDRDSNSSTNIYKEIEENKKDQKKTRTTKTKTK